MRILFNLACIISLVLMLLFIAAWIRSYQGGDRIQYLAATSHASGTDQIKYDWMMYRGGLHLRFSSDKNMLMVESRHAGDADGWSVDRGFRVTQGSPEIPGSPSYLGFAFVEKHSPLSPAPARAMQMRSLECVIPLWSLVLLLGILPAVWFPITLRRRRRARQGHCPACGYDLRASPDRCPECGSPAASSRTPKAVRR
jgi:hypothetical protein